MRLDEVLRLEIDAVPVDPSTSYPLAGVYSFGRGLIRRPLLEGSNTTYKVLHRLHEGNFVMSQLKAWEGALSRVPVDFDGWFLSPQFPTFRAVQSRLDICDLEWFFKQPHTWEQLKRESRGMGARRDSVSPRVLLGLQIPLPPLPEQRGIVARIENLSRRVEEIGNLGIQAREETEVLWTSIARRMLRGLPEEMCLRDLVTLQGGGTPSSSDPSFWEGSIPWITPKDMKSRVLRDSLDHISAEATLASPAKLIQPGAVLVVVRGMILAHTVPTAVLTTPATINQDMKAMVPAKEVSPDYLCAVLWALNPELLGLVERSTHDTRKLETDKLLDFRIPVPAIPEQERLVALLRQVEERTLELRRLQDQAVAETGILQRSLLDGVFRQGSAHELKTHGAQETTREPQASSLTAEGD
ncbi:MAG: restriction endonuclease subunit S [Thermoanaerobaculia bacterium]